MRMRLYSIGAGTGADALRCDQFPVMLGLDDETGRLTPRCTGGDCRIEDAGGQLLFQHLESPHDVLVNDQPLESGPLTPGDRLCIDGYRFVISYEQTGQAESAELHYRLS